MSYSSLAVANYFIELAAEGHERITPMKLIKLVYLAHGWHLALENAPLLDEPIEAWPYGPIVSRLYWEFREFGAEPIVRMARDDEGRPYAIPQDESGTQARFIIAKVWEHYRNTTALQLSALTHKKKSPWAEVMKHMPRHRHDYLPIPNEAIRSYYRKRLERAA